MTINNSKFSESVFRVVKEIPKGKTLTYGQVAALAGHAGAARAVGNALSKNFDPKIPCHRVIRADGKLGGYNRGFEKKARMLKKEKLMLI